MGGAPRPLKGRFRGRQDIIKRFHHAKEYVTRMKTVGKNELFTMVRLLWQGASSGAVPAPCSTSHAAVA